jgi:hypothetical protein
MQPFSPTLRVFVGCVALGLLSPSGTVSGQVLTRCVPGAVAPGQTTEITLSGTKLDGPVSVWTSFPAKVEIVPNAPKGRTQLVCKLTLAADVPVGIGGIVLTTNSGASDPLLVMIDDLPSSPAASKNNSPATAQEIPTLGGVDGASSGTLADYFRFTATAGQRLSMEVVAARLGSNFDPVLRLLDSAGEELAQADDDDSLGADCRLSHTFATAGQYLIELRDNAYKAGGAYRLRLGDFPLVSTPLPLGIRQGSIASISSAGPLVDRGQATIVAAPAHTAGGELLFSTKLPDGKSSDFATLATTDLPEIVAIAGTGKPAEPLSLVLPAAMNGVLATPGETASFEFPATKDARLTFRTVTRSLGSPTLLVLRLLDSSGKKLAESAVGTEEDATLSHVIPQTGTYRLAVTDLLGRGGAEFSYRVEARVGPAFNLVLKTEKNAKISQTKRALATSGGAFYVDVQAKRNGYDGAIELALDSPRAGFQVFNNVIAAKANETRLYIVAPSDLAAAEYVPLWIVGQARGETGGPMSRMSNLAQLRTARPLMPYPPAWLDGVVQISGAGEKPAFFTLVPDKTEVNLAGKSDPAKLTLAMDRTDAKFKDAPLTILPLDLPKGITAEVKRNGNGPKETYDITLKGPKELTDAPRSFRYFAYGEMPGDGRAIVSGEIKIVAIEPLPAAETPKAEAAKDKEAKDKEATDKITDKNTDKEDKAKDKDKDVAGNK